MWLLYYTTVSLVVNNYLVLKNVSVSAFNLKNKTKQTNPAESVWAWMPTGNELQFDADHASTPRGSLTSHYLLISAGSWVSWPVIFMGNPLSSQKLGPMFSSFLATHLFLFFVILVFGDWDFLCIPGCPGRHSVDQGGLELKNPLPLPPECWELRHGPPHGPSNTKTLKHQK